MKQGLIFGVLALLTLILLPLALLHPEESVPESGETTLSMTVEETKAAPEETPPGAAAGADDQMISVLFQGIPVEMPLGDYLTGVLLGELPGDFSAQTFAAQAVACRTYTLRVIAGGKHPDGAVCTDHRCCQAWREPLSVEREVREKAEQAVRDTEGLVLTWEGRLIDATYFSCSGGRTEDAAAVWGSPIPYLISVDSPGEEFAPRFQGSVSFSSEELRPLLLTEVPDCDLSGPLETWFGPSTETPGGGVDTMTVGGIPVPGVRLRKLLGLNSTVFTVAVSGDTACFSTRGFGHRVGMSQYGAEAMARAGEQFPAILAHYYPGTQLNPISSQ